LCRIIRHLGSGIVWGGTLTLPRQSSRSQQLALVPWDEIEQRIRRAFLNAVSTRICPFSLICAFAARLLNRSHALMKPTNMRIIAMAVLILLTLGLAQAEPRQSTERHRE
jgi:hypothetical protein